MSADDTIGPSADGLSFGSMAAREGMGVSFLLRRFTCNSEMHQTKRKTTLTDDMPGVFASSGPYSFFDSSFQMSVPPNLPRHGKIPLIPSTTV